MNVKWFLASVLLAGPLSGCRRTPTPPARDPEVARDLWVARDAWPASPPEEHRFYWD
jgi:hypothetical protein